MRSKRSMTGAWSIIKSGRTRRWGAGGSGEPLSVGARSLPEKLPQPEYDTGEIVRRVGTTKAYIRFKGQLWPVGQAFFGERVAIRPRGGDGQYGIFFGAHHIASIDLTQTEGVNHVSEQVSTMSSD